MKRTLPFMIASVVTLCQATVPADTRAQEVLDHPAGALGFHSVSAPLGGRWWFAGQKVALDAGLGFASTPAPSYDEQVTGWTLDFGVPIALKSWEPVRLLFRPGILLESQEVQATSPPDPFATDDETTFVVSAELEAEVFIVKNFSVSASHGIAFSSVDPAGGGESETSFGTTGFNFTNIGFHIYFFGASSPQ